MRVDPVTKMALIVIACLLAWDVFSRAIPSVHAQGTYSVVRLGTSPSEWTNRLNENRRKLVAVVPVQSNGPEHQNSFLLILQ